MTEMLHLELEDFLKIPYGAVFASGKKLVASGEASGWGNSDTLCWVAVKGTIDDWTMYSGWSDNPNFLRWYGRKVAKESVRDVIDVSDEVLERYRWP